MATRYILTGLLLVICSLFFIGPAGAAAPISTIHAGDVLFVGEEGLDITAAMDGDTMLGWWASGASITGASPDQKVDVSNPANFYVSPGTFGTHTGNWYRMASLTTANGTAFNVVDPQIDLRVEDTTVGVDVTNKWAPAGDDLQFRIDTNLVQITRRAGVGAVPITIKVQNPDGAILSSVVNNAGTTTSLVDYPVSTTPQYTGPIWGTGNRGSYPPGTYAVWAVCNVNSMNDNYGQTGKTISSQVSVLDQEQNPLINNKGYVTNPPTATPTSVVKTTVPTPTKSPVVTPLPTTIPETVPPTPEITSTPVPATTTPAPTTTRMPGFESACALAALIAGIVFLATRK